MNAMALGLYALVVGAALTASAQLLEQALAGLRLPVRGVWLVALALSVGLPLSSLRRSPAEMNAAASTGVETVTPVASSAADHAPVVGGSSGESLIGRLRRWSIAADRALAAVSDRLPRVEVARSTLAVGWAGASLLTTVLLIASILRIRRQAKRWPDETLLGRRVKISGKLGPATIGTLAPLIVIPRWATTLPSHELELVLRHEEEHVLSRDTLLLGLGLVALIACPWNPVVWWQVRRLKAAVELDCDRRVLRRGVAPAHYGELLFRLATRQRLPLGVPSIAGSTSLLERRLIIMSRSQGRIAVPATMAAAVAALLLTAVACTTDPPSATEVARGTESDAGGEESASAGTAEERLLPIRVNADGTILVDGALKGLDRVPEAVAALDPATTVIWLEAHPRAPYGILATLQEHLREAGLLRVVFSTLEPDGRRWKPRDLSAVPESGLAMVLPEPSPSSEVEISPRNLLFFEVRPTGVVGVRRGESPSVQLITPAQVEEVWRRAVTRNEHLIAIVQTHRETAYEHTYAVLDGLERAGSLRYSLQVAD